MKLTMKLLVLFFGVLLLASAAHAESPREQLKQMVEQLQKSPNDNALREKIIKLAQKLKPAPAVPEEAERRMVRGTAAIKGAKSVADYRDAAKEFEQATLAAPWYGDAYFNLGFVQDKAENYEAALRSLKLALLASPDDKEIKALIYEVEYRKEKADSPDTQAQKKLGQAQRKFAGLIQRLDGAVFFGVNIFEGATTHSEIRFQRMGDNNYLECSNRYKVVKSNNPEYPVMGQWKDTMGLSVSPTSETEFDGCTIFGSFRLSSDSKTLEESSTSIGGRVINTTTYRRQ